MHKQLETSIEDMFFSFKFKYTDFSINICSVISQTRPTQFYIRDNSIVSARCLFLGQQ